MFYTKQPKESSIASSCIGTSSYVCTSSSQVSSSRVSRSHHSAFTLVELIVVIAILVVLSTVGFVGYSGYSSASRDSTRLADLKNIYQALKVVQAQEGKAPNPDNFLTINNGSGSLHGLQGIIGESVRKTVNLESGGRDPLSSKPYTYYLYSSKKHFQLLGMFEKEGYQERLALL